MYHSEARRRPSQYRSLQVNSHTHYCSSSRDLRGCTVQHRHLVIFLGILIILGLVILSIGIYQKINNLNNNIAKDSTLYIKKFKNLNIKNFYINQENVIVEYEIEDKYIIHVYDMNTGHHIKKIELLK